MKTNSKGDKYIIEIPKPTLDAIMSWIATTFIKIMTFLVTFAFWLLVYSLPIYLQFWLGNTASGSYINITFGKICWIIINSCMWIYFINIIRRR